MEPHYKVVGFYNTSIGTVLIVKLPDAKIILNIGAVLRNSSNSRWRITGSGMGRKPDYKKPHNNDLLIMNYTVEFLSGDDSLNESDILFIE